MEKLTTERLKQLIDLELGEFYIEEFRKKHQIDGSSSTFYMAIKRMVEARELKKISRGLYKKISIVQPIKVFGRERRSAVLLNPPRDYDSEEALSFFEDLVFREGDLILLSGFKNKGKTALCLNLVAENLDKRPVLMGNEYTTIDNEPSPRFLNRLDSMDWVRWTNGNGKERFDLLPVYEDYAEQIKPGRLNVIDWVNLPGEYYLISPVMEGIKRALGRGIGVIVLQKNPGLEHGRGGNPSKDFADVELLLDPYGEDDRDILLTVQTVKESKRRVMGRKFVHTIRDGVKITNFREVEKCRACHGKGWTKIGPCATCRQTGYVDKKE